MITHILKLIWNKKRSNALMILEIFLSFLVLFFVLSYLFFNLERVNKPLGFETNDRWMVRLDHIDQKDSVEIISIMENLRRNLLDQEEIESVSFGQSIVPFSNSQWYDGNDANGFQVHGCIVPCDYKLGALLDIPLVEGRWFNEEDLNAAIEPLIVNKYFIDQFFPGASMIDSIIYFGGEKKLIGVVDNYRYLGEFEDVIPTTFDLNPYNQNLGNAILKMKPNTSASFEEKLANIVNATTSTTGSSISSLDKLRSDNSRESWIILIALLSICIFLCLNVALGLFGVLWYNINKRKSEIGLRQAMGAHSFDILKQFVFEILIIAGIAILIGVFFAIQIPLLDVTEYPDGLFYKSIIYTTIIILLLVTMCAFFPSIQAARITPANSLHED